MTGKDANRKAAAYARQDTVWAPPALTRPENPSVFSRTVGIVRALTAATALIAIPPALLTWFFGTPAQLLPPWTAVVEFLTDEKRYSQPQNLVTAAALLLWLVWAIMMVLLAGSAISVAAGWRLPRLRLPAPLHRMMFGLAGSAAVALISTPHAASGPATTTAVTATPDGTNPGTGILQAGRITVLVGDTEYVYQVKRGDTLSKIARRWLGDADRWPQICRLNRHEHVAAGAVLTDCDLIRPGWRLHLPDDARPPQALVPKPTPPKPTPPDTQPPALGETTTPPAAATPPPATSPSPPPAPTPPPAVTGAPSSPWSTPPTEPSTNADSARTDEHGIRLPGGSVIPWTLASALTATAGLVWLQRRRRHQPDSDPVAALPAPPLPEPMPTIQRLTKTAPATTPTAAKLPDGTVGVDGPHAEAVVRGALIAAITAAAGDDARHRAEVIIDRATIAALLDTDIEGWARLHVTGTFDDALTTLDTRLLHRARLLDNHDQNTMREPAPEQEHAPPILLIGRAIDATSRRAKVTLGLAEDLDVTTMLLGTWPAHTITTGPDLDPALPTLGRADALTLIDTIREAHTGEPPPQTTPAPTPTPPPTPQPTNATHAHLRVLGTPHVDDLTRPGRNLRAKAAELAVYLACHPDGADTDTIAEHLLPEVRRRHAAQQVHTNASNLRHVLGRAAGPTPGGYLLKRGTDARYRLDPTTVHIDLWHLRDLLDRARLASGTTRAELLREACDLATAPLADGCDYDWIEPHRETARQWATQAHLMLADDLIGTDASTANTLLDKAIRLDRYNEHLYRAAMRARHAAGDTDGVRSLLDAVTAVLAELDATPEKATVALAHDLCSDPASR
jgi:DNA-binding SARP family transcriptional activator